MENQILIFRTSITKRRDIKLKVLRIECSNITALEISETLRNSHIFATELE